MKKEKSPNPNFFWFGYAVGIMTVAGILLILMMAGIIK